MSQTFFGSARFGIHPKDEIKNQLEVCPARQRNFWVILPRMLCNLPRRPNFTFKPSSRNSFFWQLSFHNCQNIFTTSNYRLDAKAKTCCNFQTSQRKFCINLPLLFAWLIWHWVCRPPLKRQRNIIKYKLKLKFKCNHINVNEIISTAAVWQLVSNIKCLF